LLTASEPVARWYADAHEQEMLQGSTVAEFDSQYGNRALQWKNDFEADLLGL
jgi:hypothetical protein